MWDMAFLFPMIFVEGAIKHYKVGCLNGARSNFNSKKSIIWFIMISPAKFQPPNPSITARNGRGVVQ
jgi:hypothetical protein